MAFNGDQARSIAIVLGVVVLVTCMLLYLYFPAVPHSLVGWAALFVIGIPTWFFLERLGEVTLGSSFFAKLSSTARIAVAIPIVIALMVVGGLLVHFGQRVITTW